MVRGPSSREERGGSQLQGRTGIPFQGKDGVSQLQGRTQLPVPIPGALGAGDSTALSPAVTPTRWGPCVLTPVLDQALTPVLDQRLQLLAEALVPARDVHAQAVVAAGLAVGAAAPLLVGGQETAPRVRAHMVNCGDTA